MQLLEHMVILPVYGVRLKSLLDYPKHLNLKLNAVI
jgi:hypothetical protein